MYNAHTYMSCRFIALPIGRAYKLKETRPQPPPKIQVLEALYAMQSGRVTDKQMHTAAAATRMSVQEVRRWMRHRTACNRLTPMAKFCETLWRFVFYTSTTVYGYVILRDKTWYSDTRYCWVCLHSVASVSLVSCYSMMQYGFPFQEVTDDVRAYYYVEIGFYISLMYSLSTDTRRKDFYEVCLHVCTCDVRCDLIGCADGDPPHCDDPADGVLVEVGCDAHTYIQSHSRLICVDCGQWWVLSGWDADSARTRRC